jgi:chemotaxis regulatin CheY-phosphate phosphatase CheZ
MHGLELLKSWKNILGRELDFDDIGELIQEYRNKQELKGSYSRSSSTNTQCLQQFLEQVRKNEV